MIFPYFCGLIINKLEYYGSFPHVVFPHVAPEILWQMNDLKVLEPLFGVVDGTLPSPLVIAGPCSAESREQTLETAVALAGVGVRYFRAGVWKPRTRPGSFDGMGARALPWLVEVREKTGMVPVTEVATAAHLRSALRAGIDAFWIGARTSANPFAVQEIADLLAGLPAASRQSLTFMVKNPVNPDIELWIGAFQRLYAAGIRRLGAIHRGFSAYGEHLYRNMPEWRVPIELKRRIPALPLICDPSHIGGRRDLVASLSQQALDMNFDGLIIESHCAPERALSDSSQQVTPLELGTILSQLRTSNGNSAAASLRSLRDEIDRIDVELVSLLARRMEVAREIGKLKHREGISVVQPERYGRLMERRVADGCSLGLSPEFMKNILGTIHEESVRQQLALRKQPNADNYQSDQPLKN